MSRPIEHELRSLAARPPPGFADAVVAAVAAKRRAPWTTREVLLALASFGAFAAAVHAMAVWSVTQVSGA